MCVSIEEAYSRFLQIYLQPHIYGRTLSFFEKLRTLTGTKTVLSLRGIIQDTNGAPVVQFMFCEPLDTDSYPTLADQQTALRLFVNRMSPVVQRLCVLLQAPNPTPNPNPVVQVIH